MVRHHAPRMIGGFAPVRGKIIVEFDLELPLIGDGGVIDLDLVGLGPGPDRETKQNQQGGKTDPHGRAVSVKAEDYSRIIENYPATIC